MTILMYLLLAHFLIDWCWQTQFIAENKHKMPMIMLAHVSAWTLGICAVLDYFGIFAWWKFAMLFIGHWLEDYWKATEVERVNKYGYGYNKFIASGFHQSFYENWKHKYFSKLLWMDQSFHFLQLFTCVIK